MSARSLVRILLGASLVATGVAHLTFARKEFRVQVPPGLPVDADDVVIASGVAEIGLGAGLVVAPRTARPFVGGAAAAFLVAVFPGNLAQWAFDRDGFGLDSGGKRLARLLLQPLLVAAAIWSTRR